MFKIISLSLATFLLTGNVSHAASRYYYDVQKFDAILKSKELEKKLGERTLDGIKMYKVDSEKKEISYNIISGHCSLVLVLSFNDGFEPDYKVASVSDLYCD